MEHPASTYSDSDSVMEDLPYHTEASTEAYADGSLGELYEARTDRLDELVFYAVSVKRVQDNNQEFSMLLAQNCKVKQLDKMEKLLQNMEKLKKAEEQCYDAIEKSDDQWH